MIEDENLHHFISEDIFVLNDEEQEMATPVGVNPVIETPTIPPVEEVQKTAPVIPETHVVEEPVPVIEKPTAAQVHELIVLVLPMNAQDKELLQNLLKAIKKTEADIKLINSYADFKGNCKKLLSFGYLNELKHQIDDSLEPYKVIKNQDKEMLISTPLSALHNNKPAKGALWKCLQEMFL
jgi:DNA polymerase III psi subunit